jgi:hypothetical protein
MSTPTRRQLDSGRGTHFMHAWAAGQSARSAWSDDLPLSGAETAMLTAIGNALLGGGLELRQFPWRDREVHGESHQPAV